MILLYPRSPMTQWLADTYDRIIFWLLVVQYVFVNLIFTTYTQNIVILKDLSAPLISILIFLFWVCGDLAKYGRWVLPRHGIVPATVGALLFWLVSIFAGSSPATGVELWGRMWGYFIEVWAVLRFFDTYRKFSIFLRFALVTNLLIVFYGQTQLMGADILVELGIIPDWGSGVFVSTHGNPNFLAGYLITSYPLLVGYWFISRNPVIIFGLPVLFLFNLYHVKESTARGAYIASALYMVIVPICLFLNRRNLHLWDDPLRKLFLRAAGIVLLIALVLAPILAHDKFMKAGKEIYDQFYSMVDYESNYTNWVRLVFDQMALDGSLRYPWFGRGIASFNWQMPETRPVWYHRWGVSHNTDHPHNEHLEWLHDTGMLGMTFFWWILMAYGATGIREIWRHRRGYYFPLILSTFMGPWMQWIQGTFDVETRWTGNGVTMWTTIGIVLAFANLPVILKREDAEASGAIRVQPALQPNSGRRRVALRQAVANVVRLRTSPYLSYVAAALGLCLVFYSVQAWDFWLADHHLRNNMMFTDGGAGSAQKAIEEAEQARKLNYSSTSNYYKLAYSYLVAQRPKDAMEAYRDLQSFAPNYAQIHVNLAYLDDQMGYRPASAWERTRASEIEHNTRNNRDAAQYWLNLGYPYRALAHLRKCFTINLDRTEGGYFYWYDRDNVYADLARVYASIGERHEAEQELKQALRLNPSNMTAALLLTQMLAETGDRSEADSLVAMLKRYAPENPALVALEMSHAVEAQDFAHALDLAERVAFSLSIPNGAASQEGGMLGNALLGAIQTIYAAKFEPARCLEVAGWIYAVQGRFPEAQSLLTQSFNVSHNPRTAERLGQVRSRLQAQAPS